MAGLPATGEGNAEISVGYETGEIAGKDNRSLQAAVDYVAGLGGGTVRVGPGRYLMRNALVLRDRVKVLGAPGQTVLAACDGAESPLELDGDCNERQITLADPSAFRTGDGVAIQDDHAGGFTVTTATLTSQVDAKTFRISNPLYLDYMVASKAKARLVFPVVGGWCIKNAAVEGLTIEGNRGKSQPLNGCRGGGIYLFECTGVGIRNCVVRSYNGDGISFQVSEDVAVEDCVCEKNAGLGLHPGSGSQRPVLRRNRSSDNEGDGMFVCWRVKHGVFEANEIRGNKGHGISIGHKDTDNVFRGNTIVGNLKAGVLFRDENEPMAAHRNLFEGNTILDNGAAEKPGSRAAIVVLGHTHDLVFRKNKIGWSKGGAEAGAGIRIGEHAQRIDAGENEFANVSKDIQR